MSNNLFNVPAAEYTLSQLKADRTKAKKLSPALLPMIAAELEVREAAFKAGLDSVKDYEAESVELARAAAVAAAARNAAAFSIETDPTIAEKLLRAAELANHLEKVRARRAEAARDRATSQLYKAEKGVAARAKAVSLAETIAGAVLDRDEQKMPATPSPDVLAYMRIVLPVEGRDWYIARAANREGNRSFDPPKPVTAYDLACESFWARVASDRARAQETAAALAAV